MPSNRPVSSQVNAPVPVPLIILLLEIVGFCVFAYTIPRSVIVQPPSFITFPVTEADLLVICIIHNFYSFLYIKKVII